MTNGILFSIGLETLILVRQMKLVSAFKTACGMSLISMISMEISMNLVDFLLVGELKLTMEVIPIMLFFGFITSGCVGVSSKGIFGTGVSVAGKSYSFTDHPTGETEVQNQRLYCTMHGHYAGSSRGVAVDTVNKVFVTYDPDTDSGIQNSDCSVAVTSSQQSGVGTNINPLRADYNDTAMVVYGYTHTDYVQTSSKADTINTYAGNDQVLAKAGADTVNLGDGNDVAFVTALDLTEDTLSGGDGSDTLSFARVVASRWHTYANEAVSWRAWSHDFGVTANLSDILADTDKNISGF
mgnify:CR=1 FL=1